MKLNNRPHVGVVYTVCEGLVRVGKGMSLGTNLILLYNISYSYIVTGVDVCCSCSVIRL